MDFKFKWDHEPNIEPDRGWCCLPDDFIHPDDNQNLSMSRCCGFYMTYGASDSHRGPDGAPIMAQAYIFRLERGKGIYDKQLGTNWFWSTADAVAWIERAVTNELESILETPPPAKPRGLNACKYALDVQDACNISGVFLGLNKLVEQICKDYSAEPRGIGRNDYFRKHPALILYLDKMCDLMRWDRDQPEDASYRQAYHRALEYAKENPE